MPRPIRLARLVGTAVIPAALVLALVGVPTAAAVEPSPAPSPAPAVVQLDPVPGGLAAAGRGSVRIHVPQDGTVTGTIRVGRLRVRGAEAVTVEKFATKETLKDGSVLYRGVQGSFSVGGKTFTLWMAGDGLRFTATGDGIAFLQGRGKFRVDDHAVRGWKLRGVHVRF
jgi:hypothetical protein